MPDIKKGSYSRVLLYANLHTDEKKKLCTGKLQSTGVLVEDSSLTTDRDELLTEHKSSMKDSTHGTALTLNLPIRRCKTRTSCGQAFKKKGKAPRPDNITIKTIYKRLVVLFNECPRESKVH